ncbi:MAG: MBOAT family protein [Deltaproteobacteria bacterium]|nr:MBOAT family protein [Deltaproteobacteria bacterium]
MHFTSVQYLVFFLAIYLVYWRLNARRQNILLLAASYFFYANWNWRMLGLIVLVTAADYFNGLRIHRASSQAQKRFWLTASVAVNLGILAGFKYFNFFIESFAALAASTGFAVSFSTLNIILPIGISFYTFRSLSYTIDVYRGRLEPTASLIDYAAFVSFFPHLAAGPITRAKEFLFQLEKKRSLNGEDMEEGLRRFLLGFFKKAFIADTLGFYVVDKVFASPADYSSGALWLGMLAYTVQIYADFSGYSNMAIGSARLLGLKLPENFAFPYLSKNVSEFWRRWHITMSGFFRDYVYITLGGNRKGRARTIFNLAATTLVSGLWHGAGLTFVLWGALHGAYITIYHLWRGDKKEAAHQGLFGWFMAWLVTQLAVGLAWILFRSPNAGVAWIYMKGLVAAPGVSAIEVPLLVHLAFAAFIADHFAGWLMERRPTVMTRIPVCLQAVAYAAMILFLYHARIEAANPFIYFQF